MVQAQGDNRNTGQPHTLLHSRLLLKGPSRTELRDELCQLASYYIRMTDGKGPTVTSIENHVDTWCFPYEHATYNPAPPYVLQMPDLQVYVTRAYAPSLTVL
eukprot:CAMPEP_0170468920 /NCGR_PEP_ID=MMETSP0123-20130129/11925_1 /TAXON_ID=182087 /ORGANISM="Favella ehrenbergii, Strain Fehren 1" /LENGTH=101 /DNA_ID=CAMNT_0010735621 /DNA_START=12 /DNA_END=317 /DNA_ORIENTATION=+